MCYYMWRSFRREIEKDAARVGEDGKKPQFL